MTIKNHIIAGQLIFAFLLITLCIQCSDKKSSQISEQTPSIADEPETVKDSIIASCIWDNVALRQDPSDKGKYLTALSIGEVVTVLPNAIDTADVYVKIRLNDGTEGWSKKDFIVSNGQPHVNIKDADIYNRPDALTKTDKKFSKYDIVAVTSSREDFLEVKGKRSDGKWIETGWIKSSNLSNNKLDIAAAKFIQKALAEKNDEKKITVLQEIASNSDLKDSQLIVELHEIINTIQAKQMEIVTEEVLAGEVNPQ
ncbi:MAG TPA: SH3 domain-containing protein [Chryseosolibacter sp.]|nr:SH3 domain-containing protein [Chryseosolibacter sp.]